LGVEPAAETTALYERIRAATSVRRHNLPLQSTPFVGRSEELAEIIRLLANPDCRLLTLLGPGGIGKTRLALQAAAARNEAFLEGVYFVPLAAVSSAEFLVSAIAEALTFSFFGSLDPKAQIFDYLRGKEVLLILDSFEHLLSPAREGEEGGTELLVEMLQKAPGVKLLVTSRERLNLRWEWCFEIKGLKYPKRGTTNGKELEDYSAVELFQQVACRVHRRFSLSGRNKPAIACICQLVEGMPLGIELAAAWVGARACEEIAREIERSQSFLVTSLRDVPARHRSMRAVFDHSWNLLTERQREVLQALSVFCGSFTHQTAHQVVGASSGELTALVDKSLLHCAPTPSTLLGQASRSVSGADRTGERYAIHELLRQYAAEKLAQSPAARNTAHNRHSAHYSAALKRWEANLKSARQQTALAEIEADGENARAAWNWAVERGQAERLMQMIDGLCRFYEWRGRYREGEAACRAAAEKLEAAASDTGLRIWAKTLAWRGVFSRELGRAELRDQLLRQSLALLDEPVLAGQDTRQERAFILLQMGRAVSDSNREEAHRLYEQSLALSQALGNRWEIARALDALGWLAWLLGEYGEAKQRHEESLAIRRALDDQRGIANSLDGLGRIALYKGQLEEAERLKQESVATHREIGDRAGIATGLRDLGVALLFRGKFVEAHALLEESLAIWNDVGSRRSIASSHMWLGLVKGHLGRYEQARAQVHKGLALAQEIGYPHETGAALLVLGDIALAEGAYAEAHQLSQESVIICQEIGQQVELAGALATLGIAAWGLDDLRQARQHLYQALRMAARIRAAAQLLLTLAGIALLLAKQSQWERAVELYALLSRYPTVANSRRYEDTFGRHISAIAASLPPDVVAAAQERGRARKLKATVIELLVEEQ